MYIYIGTIKLYIFILLRICVRTRKTVFGIPIDENNNIVQTKKTI